MKRLIWQYYYKVHFLKLHYKCAFNTVKHINAPFATTEPTVCAWVYFGGQQCVKSGLRS